MKKYIVKDGDTMWSISKKTGIRLNLLVAANPQIRDPNQLQPGSVIMIPELTKSNSSNNPAQPVPAQKAPVPKGGQKGTPTSDSAVPPYFGFVWPHVVKEGETWNEIADQYGISSTQLQHLNPKESPGTLDPGDIVYVPAFGFDGAGSQPGMPYPGMHQQPQPGTEPGLGGHGPSPWPYGPGPQPGYAGYPAPYAYPGWQYPGMYPPQMPGGQSGMPMPPEQGVVPNTHGPHTHMPPRGEDDWWRTPGGQDYGYPYYQEDFYDPYLYRYSAQPGYGAYAAGVNPPLNPYADDESFPDWGPTDFADVEIRNYELPPTKRSDPQSQDD